MKTLVIVNGLPRSGKDTAIEIMRGLLSNMGVFTRTFSSIEPVRSLLANAVDLSAKTPADRKLLSVVGDALQEHSGFRVKHSLKAMREFFLDEGEGVFFLQVREPDLIESIRKSACANEIMTIRLLVKSPRSEAPHARADSVVGQGTYDYTINNAGDLYDLDAECQRFIQHFHLI